MLKKKNRLFLKYPQVQYNLQGDKKILTNIMVRNKIKDTLRTNGRIFYGYDLQEGDTPEIIADKYYDDAGLHWIVMMMNITPDGRWDVGMDYQTFSNYVNDKYKGVTLNTNSFSGDIKVGAKITGVTSGAEGIVLQWNPSTGRIGIDQSKGSFEKGEQANTVMIASDGTTLEGSMQFGQYKIATIKATHHYEDTKRGTEVDYTQWLSIPADERREVSNIVYEEELNQKSRTVRLLKPQYVDQVVQELKTLLNPDKAEV